MEDLEDSWFCGATGKGLKMTRNGGSEWEREGGDLGEVWGSLGEFGGDLGTFGGDWGML